MTLQSFRLEYMIYTMPTKSPRIKQQDEKKPIPEQFPPSALEEAIHFLHANLGTKKCQGAHGFNGNPGFRNPRPLNWDVCVSQLLAIYHFPCGPTLNHWLLTFIQGWYELGFTNFQLVGLHLLLETRLSNGGNLPQCSGCIFTKHMNTPPSHYPPGI